MRALRTLLGPPMPMGEAEKQRSMRDRCRMHSLFRRPTMHVRSLRSASTSRSYIHTYTITEYWMCASYDVRVEGGSGHGLLKCTETVKRRVPQVALTRPPRPGQEKKRKRQLKIRQFVTLIISNLELTCFFSPLPSSIDFTVAKSAPPGCSS